MDYLGIILFFWILGGTGLVVMWADRLAQRDRTNIFFRAADERWSTQRSPGLITPPLES